MSNKKCVMRPQSVRFKFLTGDVGGQEYGGSFISKKFNNGDWDYWLVMEVTDLGSTTDKGREYTEYNVSVSAVSPEAAGTDNLIKALESIGFEGGLPEYFQTDIGKVEVLAQYGIQAQLFS